MRAILFCSLFFLLPTVASAAVTFSEVAWMGSATSANHEWIELHNDGSDVDVTGWTISDGANLNTSLAGTIPAGAHVVLERTSDDSAPGTAFLIYTGALVNTGASLRLLRADGSVEDQVSGGEDWQNIGGDNVTKETAQYTSGGWVTAAATPGRAVTATEVTVAAADTTKTDTTSRGTSGGSVQKAKPSEPVILTLPDVTLKLAVKAQTVGYVHQSIGFDVIPSGIGDTLIDSLSYEWNFGDGSVGSGKEARHIYDYPGTYVVTVYAGFKRQEQVARHEITILPVTLSLTTTENGDVQINNDSPYELDISGYRVVGNKEFIFPPRTIMLPNQTITLPRARVSTRNEGVIIVYDTEKAAVTTRYPDVLTRNSVEVENDVFKPVLSARLSEQPEPEEWPDNSFRFTAVGEVAEDNEKVVESDEEQRESQMVAVAEAAGEQMVASAAPLQTTERWPYLALAATILLAVFGLYAAPRR
jgi:hypothetical protein